MILASSFLIVNYAYSQKIDLRTLPENAETVLGNWYTNNLNSCRSTGFSFDRTPSGQVIPSMMGTANNDSLPFPIRNESYDAVIIALKGWPLQLLGQTRWSAMIDIFNSCNQFGDEELQVVQRLISGNTNNIYADLESLNITALSNHYQLLKNSTQFSNDAAGKVRLYNNLAGFMRENLDINPDYSRYLSEIFFELYRAYNEGVGTIASQRAAFLNLRDASTYGNPSSYYLLGMRFLNGQGTDLNGTDAYENFKRAIAETDVGDEALAMHRMGEVLYEARNEEEALKWGLLALNACNNINNADLPLSCDGAQMIQDRNEFYRDHMSNREEQQSEDGAYQCSLGDIEDCGPERVRVRLGRAIGAMNPFDWFGR